MSTYGDLMRTIKDAAILRGKFIITFYAMNKQEQWVPLARVKATGINPNTALRQAIAELPAEFMPGMRFAFEIDREPEP